MIPFIICLDKKTSLKQKAKNTLYSFWRSLIMNKDVQFLSQIQLLQTNGKVESLSIDVRNTLEIRAAVDLGKRAEITLFAYPVVISFFFWNQALLSNHGQWPSPFS
jgi:hypothetical protein